LNGFISSAARFDAAVSAGMGMPASIAASILETWS